MKIEDKDYALFYRDITEEPDKYKGKTVEFKGQSQGSARKKEGMFAPLPVRHDLLAEADITSWASSCRFVGAEGLKARWGHGQKKGRGVRHYSLYRGVGPT